jgi:Protein of unknown function (DUF3309).
MYIILIVLLVLLLVGGLPNWGYHSYGWGPSGMVGVVVVVLLIMMLMGVLR